MVSFRPTKFRTGCLWRVGSGQKMFASKKRLVDSDTAKVMKFPFPLTGALFPSFGPTISRTPRTHMLSLCKLRTSMTSRLYSLSWFFFNDHGCEFFGSFPLPLLHIICARYHTFIPECPSGFSISRAPWSSGTVPYVFSSRCLSTSCSYFVSQPLGN